MGQRTCGRLWSTHWKVICYVTRLFIFIANYSRVIIANYRRVIIANLISKVIFILDTKSYFDSYFNKYLLVNIDEEI